MTSRHQKMKIDKQRLSDLREALRCIKVRAAEKADFISRPPLRASDTNDRLLGLADQQLSS